MDGFRDNDGDMSFGDELSEVLTQYLKTEKRHGLTPLAFPTGSGKSYAVHRAMAALAREQPEGAAPIVYVTPQKKNIPAEAAILGLLEKAGCPYGPHDVLRLWSNTEMLQDTVNQVDEKLVPTAQDLRKDFIRLREDVRRLGGVPRYEDVLKESIARFRRRVKRVFRRADWQNCEGRTLNREECLARLESDPMWQWLGVLWPAVFLTKARILLVTASKLFSYTDTLVEQAQLLCDMPFFDDAIIFMDEFDDVKQSVLSSITSNAVSERVDLTGLIRTLYTGIQGASLPQSVVRGNEERIRRLQGVLSEKVESLHVDIAYKSSEGTLGSNGLFLYDGSRRGVTFGAKYWVHTDVAKNVNVITKERHGGDDCRLAQHVFELRKGLVYAQGVIRSMVMNLLGNDAWRLTDEELRPHVYSVLEVLGIRSSKDMRFMFEGVRNLMRGRRADKPYLGENASMYEQGFCLVGIEDADTHAFSTHINVYGFDRSPEALLVSLMKRTRIVGLSATALVESPLCNFDLEYLREYYPELMHELPKDCAARLAESYARHMSGCERVEVRTHAIRVATKDAYRLARMIVRDGELVDMVTNELFGCNHEFSRRRYVRLALAYRYFLENVDRGIFVAATSASPKDYRGEHGELLIERLQKLFDFVRRDVGTSDPRDSCKFITGSKGFEDRYGQIVSELDTCRRVFVCAAYGSLATGVNLQYPVPAGMDVVPVYSSARVGEVDIVGVYMDQVTSIAPNGPMDEAFNPKEILKRTFELRELSWAGEVSEADVDKVIISLLGGQTRKVKLTDKPSVMRACTRMVVQMVGRMARTPYRARTTHIVFDHSLAEGCDCDAMDKTLIGYETGKLLDALRTEASHEPVSHGGLELRAAARSMSLAGFISDMVRADKWRTESMAIWKEIRRIGFVTPCPTLEQMVGRWCSDVFVATNGDVTSYRYLQKTDYTHIEVSFSPGDETEFPYEVSAKEARLDVLVAVPEARDAILVAGGALRWEPHGYLMSPTYFHNIYLGQIGEVVGRQILELMIPGLRFEDIDEPEKFEKFDARVVGTGVYVDFKNWKGSIADNGPEMIAKIRRKAERVGAEHVLLVNLMRCDDFGESKCGPVEDDELMVSVPWIIDDRVPCVDMANVLYVREWLLRIGAVQ